MQSSSIRSSLAIALIGLCSVSQAQLSTTAGEIIEQIKSNVTCEWRTETVDNLKSGNHDSQVTGIATTFLANMEVIKKAHAAGLNMIITHEPTFWNHHDEREPYLELPIYKEKLAFIEENNMVIWRFHDHWHLTNPDGIYHGMTAKLNWEDFREERNFYKIKPKSLTDLATELQNTFNAEGIRVVGDPDLIVEGVAASLGAASYLGHLKLLSRDDVDVLIIGESREWETVEFVRDAQGLGKDKALILLGHAISEEAGMEYCAEWLKGFIKNVPVQQIDAGEPFWSPDK